MLTFGRSKSSDVLTALKIKASDFENDSSNTELANQCAIDAWSLCDWVFKEHGQQLSFEKLSDIQEYMKKKCYSMSLFQDVANASKHMIITKYSPMLKEAKVHKGAFSSAFSSAFDITELSLVGKDGTSILFKDALNEVVSTWNEFFKEKHLY